MKEQHQPFEQLKHMDLNGDEFWSARALARLLEYSEYRHFIPVLDRAREACVNSRQSVEDHFEDVLEMVKIGSGRTMPENLPSPDKSIKQLQSANNKLSIKSE